MRDYHNPFPDLRKFTAKRLRQSVLSANCFVSQASNKQLFQVLRKEKRRGIIKAVRHELFRRLEAGDYVYTGKGRLRKRRRVSNVSLSGQTITLEYGTMLLVCTSKDIEFTRQPGK